MFLFSLFFAFLIAIGKGDDYTCSDSSSLKAVVTQCSSVTWSVARLIDHNNTNENEYYPVVLDFDEQENRVTQLYHYYQENISLSTTCKGSLLDFVCGEVYPKCLYSYPYTAYWSVCKSECDILQENCGPIPNLDCNQFKSDSFECYRLVTSNQFLLSYSGLDNYAVYCYGVSFVLSFLLLAYWSYYYFRYYTQSTSLHTFITILLAMKTILDLLLIFIYKDVSNNKGVGSNTQGIIVVCSQLLYDSLFYFIMFLVTKGWCILYGSLLTSEWIRYYILAILFYCADGSIMIFNIEQTSSLLYHILCLLLYAIIAFELFQTNNYALFKTRMRMERIYRDGLDPYKHPTYYKYLTFYLLYLILLLKTACMVIRHVLFPLIGMDSSRLAVTALSTFSEFVVLLLLTLLYRPQIESNIYISNSADDSDYVVMISVILTTYLKENDSVKGAKECVIIFPGEDNYRYAQQNLCISDEDKKLYLAPPEAQTKKEDIS